MILSTVPAIEVLGCSGIRVISKFSSAIRADLAMRGFAISFLTLACVAVSGSLLCFLCGIEGL
jgi:hypothetical protein